MATGMCHKLRESRRDRDDFFLTPIFLCRNKCEFTVGVDSEGLPSVGFRRSSFKGGSVVVDSPLTCEHINKASKIVAAGFQKFIRWVRYGLSVPFGLGFKGKQRRHFGSPTVFYIMTVFHHSAHTMWQIRLVFGGC